MGCTDSFSDSIPIPEKNGCRARETVKCAPAALERKDRDDIRVLFASPEVFPLAKTGGLADVSAALPAALSEVGVDVRVAMPGYTEALDLADGKQKAVPLGNILGLGEAAVIAARTPDTGIPLWLVDCPALFRRPGGLYGDTEGRDWPDNALRFALFSHVVARLALGKAGANWRPHVAHVNDWHLGLVPALLAAQPCPHGGGEDPPKRKGTGFTFDAPTSGDLAGAVECALDLYRQPAAWRGMQRRAMRQDFRWMCSAQRYQALYAELVQNVGELRDGDAQRYGGMGVLRALKNVESEIAPALIGRDPVSQAAIDQTLNELDGTPNKSRLGANAILGVSMACARAAATALGKPLYAYLSKGTPRLPMPMMNVLNGGKHADSSLDFQEFMIMPLGAPTFTEAVRYAAETFQALRSLLKARGHATSVGDEGGFAPKLPSNEAACELIVTAIERAGYRPGEDIAIALDPAASSFHDGSYNLERSGQGRKTSAELIQFYQDWVRKFPIVSIEDGLAETDWDGFRRLTTELGERIQIVGDDIFVTNTDFIRRGIAEKSANAALIKLNQIGTVSETIAVIECRKVGWGYVISHRSGCPASAPMAQI